jgi:hypothetical protein
MTSERPSTDFAWAFFHLGQGRKLRRRAWPQGWRVWKLAMEYPEDTQIICGWGWQIGAFDSEHVSGLGTDGMLWTPRPDDKTATDWELL